jgi:hypothetical protein
MGAFIVAFLTFVVAPAVVLAMASLGGIVLWHSIDHLRERFTAQPASTPATVVAFPVKRVARDEQTRHAA